MTEDMRNRKVQAEGEEEQKTGAGSPEADAGIGQDSGPAGNDRGLDETGKHTAQAEEYLQLLQRVQADFDNFRKRTAQERADWSKYCSMRLATSLLPILDNFERALKAGGDDLDSFREGIELIYRQLKDVLEKDGIKIMETVGKEFDPNFHDAVMQGPSEEYPDNTVMEEFQKGYILVDRVLRPAMVKVAKS